MTYFKNIPLLILFTTIVHLVEAQPASPQLSIKLMGLESLAGAVGRFTDFDNFYKIKISNVGDAPTQGMITVVDTLPSYFEVLSYSTGSPWNCNLNGQILTCTSNETLAPGQAMVDNIGFKVNYGVSSSSHSETVAYVFGGGDISHNSREFSLKSNMLETGFVLDGSFRYELKVKVLLQGGLSPFLSDGLMRDNLRVLDLLKSFNPRPSLYSPVYFEKSISDISDYNTLDEAIVDWVQVELIPVQGANKPEKLHWNSLVQRNGHVVDFNLRDDGLGMYFDLTFYNDPPEERTEADSLFYVGIKHRNHFGVMTANPVKVSSDGVLRVDFTTLSAADTWHMPDKPEYDGLEQADIGNGLKALWAGDVNDDGKIKYAATVTDARGILTDVLNDEGNATELYNYNLAAPVYLPGDVNLDGKVKYRGADSDAALLQFNVLNKYPLNKNKLYNFDLFLEQYPD